MCPQTPIDVLSLCTLSTELPPKSILSWMNAGEGLVKQITCNDIPGRLEEWHRITASKWVCYRLQTQTSEWLECSTAGSLGDISRVQKATLQLYRRNVPLLHTPRYVTAHDQFYQAFPHISMEVTNTGVRRPGYEANKLMFYSAAETLCVLQDSLHCWEATHCSRHPWYCKT